VPSGLHRALRSLPDSGPRPFPGAAVGRRGLPAPGYTLLEVVTVLALLAAALVPTTAGARRIVDRLAVEGAREELVGLVSRARLEGLLRGEARLVITEGPAGIVLSVPRRAPTSVGRDPRSVARLDPAGAYGVRVAISGRARRATLRFGPLGLGSMTSRTVTLHRGRSRAAVVVSTHGRVRRR